VIQQLIFVNIVILRVFEKFSRCRVAMVTRMLTVHLNNKLEHHYELQHCNGYKTILFFVYICNIYGSRSIGFISYFTHERMASYTQLFMVNVGFVYVPLTYKSMLICWDTPVFLFL